MCRLERNQEREKDVTDLEYLKNVVLKVSINKSVKDHIGVFKELNVNGVYYLHTNTFVSSSYRIAQNSGGGILWRIWRIERHSPIFYPAKSIQ